jgi:hypothetical protein
MMQFYDVLEATATPHQCWRALQDLAETLVGAKLFTIMTVDMPNLLACRAYTSNPNAYPVSGTKSITIDRWFDVVHLQQKIFVANTIAEIARVFPDHEKIWSLGCGAVVNLPVVVDGELVATINMLHEEHYYTKARVNVISGRMPGPSLAAYLRARGLAQQ